MTLHVLNSLLLAATLVFQSVMPCCAGFEMVFGERSPDASVTTVCTCPCCPMPSSDQVPFDRESPEPVCPFCLGAVDVVASVSCEFNSNESDVTLAADWIAARNPSATANKYGLSAAVDYGRWRLCDVGVQLLV